MTATDSSAWPELRFAESSATDPDAALLAFLQSSYRAAADLGHWDAALECALGVPGRPRQVAAGASRSWRPRRSVWPGPS